VIELEEVRITVRGRTIIRSASASLQSASITRLIGPNGSGKTSLIRAIAGIQRFSGSIRFDGADAARVRPGLYVCFDDAPVIPALSGYENVRMLVGRNLPRSTIAEFAPLLADHGVFRRPARTLSQGERRRLHLIAALLSGAKYLIFDEALNGVDAPTIDKIQRALATHAADASVLITGHHDDAYERFPASTLRLANGVLSREVAR
jgi:ABC-type multidrug transport system ATPase subunit